MRTVVIGACLMMLLVSIGSQAQENYPTVAYKRADDHMGEIVWIQGTVLTTDNAPEGVYLCFHNNKKYIRVLIPEQYKGNFEGGFKYAYVGKEIKAIGKVDKYGSQLIVAVSEPKRIRVVEKESE